VLEPIVELQNVKRYFEVERDFIQKFNPKARKFVKAVDGVSFNIEKGEVFGLVGESGSGKTTTGKLILDVIKPTAGKILFEKRTLPNYRKEK